ncbi:MAG TPA: hypothetical protein VEH06_16690 [Candidatus Bathyarchaeia archaeon]|nr:hypothetical protein [Candidatus Bathyarchaeia archaeon]
MTNTKLEDERLKKTFVVILAVVAVVMLSTTPLITGLQNALAATSLMHASVTYAAHHYAKTCGFKAFTQGKCFPRI